MAVKRKLTKAEYEKLSDEAKKQYKQGEFSDTYVLDLDDDSDDPEELRRALAREREDRKKAQKELRDLKAASDDDDGDDGDDSDDDGEPERRGRPKGKARQAEDAAKIDRDWKKKYDKDIAGRDAKLSAKDAFIKKTMVEGVANAIAAKISTSPELLAPKIIERLTVDFDGDEPELVINGEDGKPNGMSLEKLEKEFVANKKYAAIIIGSKATGGGAPKGGADNKTGGGAPASDTTVDLSKLAPKDLAATLKARKEANA